VTVKLPETPAVALSASAMASVQSAPVVVPLSARSCQSPSAGFPVSFDAVPLVVVGLVAASKLLKLPFRAPHAPNTIKSRALLVVTPATDTAVAAAASVVDVLVTSKPDVAWPR
jgi:hypothetical protein